MYWFRFFMAAVFAACLGAAAHAEEVSFCVLNDFLQIVTFKGPDTECLEFESSIKLNSEGSQGPQGDPGPEGKQGIPGEQGPAGTDGASVFVNTSPEPPGENCPDGGIKVESGQGDTITTTAYVCDGAAGPEGETGAEGPEGKQGPQGETGAQGETGPTGARGETGAIGLQGETGPPGHSRI